MYGIALMLGYLGFDGFTSTFQDKLFKGYQMETYNQMLWVNFSSAIISSFWLLSDASMGKAIEFIQVHP
jgi:adenosine 3'-phospho 5'-phosphosulfate transporter B2